MRFLPPTGVLVAAVIAIATPVLAEVPTTKPLAGSWSGKIALASRAVPVPITLDATAVDPGAKAGSLLWGSPLSCRSTLEFSGMKGAAYTLTAGGGSGPHCDKVRNGYAEIGLTSETTATFIFFDAKGAKLYDAEIEKTK
jgi:hypothetical protein